MGNIYEYSVFVSYSYFHSIFKLRKNYTCVNLTHPGSNVNRIVEMSHNVVTLSGAENFSRAHGDNPVCLHRICKVGMQQLNGYFEMLKTARCLCQCQDG